MIKLTPRQLEVLREAVNNAEYSNAYQAPLSLSPSEAADLDVLVERGLLTRYGISAFEITEAALKYV